MKKRLFLIFICFACFINNDSKAQNLVPNPSFEQTNTCNLTIDPSAGLIPIDTIYYTNNTNYPTVTNWVGANALLPVYFNRCSTDPKYSIPTNLLGTQETHTGNGYIAFEVFFIAQGCPATQRRYIQTKLIQSLQKGKKYCVRYYISPVGYSNKNPFVKFVSTTDLYLVLTPQRLFNPLIGGICLPTDNFMITLPPNTDHIAPAQAFTDTTQWHKVQGVYTAKGGEEWLTLGCFKDDIHVTYAVVKDGSPAGIECGYYLDDVSVIELPDLLTHRKDTIVCAFPTTLTANIGFSSYLWNTGDTSRSIAVHSAGQYWVRGNLDDCGIVSDTINVHTAPAPLLHISDTLLCSSDLPLQIAAASGFTRYVWSNGSTAPTATLAQSGIYTVAADWQCGTVRDTFRVVAESPLPAIRLGNDTVSCMQGHFRAVQLSAPTGLPAYVWNTGETTLHILAQCAGIYTLEAHNICGTVRDEITLIGCEPSIYIPTAFTPNGDGHNDSFTLYSNDAVKIIKRFEVFDRYGEIVFSAKNSLPNDESAGWNGTMHGRAFTPDVFVYLIEVEYLDGTTELLKGDVTLVK
jgi:gliding motility-associated-like protein